MCVGGYDRKLLKRREAAINSLDVNTVDLLSNCICGKLIRFP